MRKNSIYTRTGDQGQTSLVNGHRVGKDHELIEIYGGLDELNACLGCVLSQNIPDAEKKILVDIQNFLFEVGTLVSFPKISNEQREYIAFQVSGLEAYIDRVQQEITMPQGFVLPGGCCSAALCHWSRTACRRVERLLYSQVKKQTGPSEVLIYINRLSDFLFVLALKLNFIEGREENLWQKRCGFGK